MKLFVVHYDLNMTKYIVRQWEIGSFGTYKTEPIAIMADTIEEARSVIPSRLHRQGYRAGDDPTVVETWF